MVGVTGDPNVLLRFAKAGKKVRFFVSFQIKLKAMLGQPAILRDRCVLYKKKHENSINALAII